MKLYHYPFSPPAEAARIVLDEKGLVYEKVAVDLPGQEHRTPDFLAMHYRGLVPVLEDGTTLVAESNVIAEYLEDAYPTSPALLPTSPADRARVRFWVATLQIDWHPLRQALYHEGILKPLGLLPGPGDRQRLMTARRAMVPHLEALERELTRQGDTPGLVGSYSFADSLFTPTLYILRKAALLPRGFTAVARWSERCLSRPSAPTWLDRHGTR